MTLVDERLTRYGLYNIMTFIRRWQTFDIGVHMYEE